MPNWVNFDLLKNVTLPMYMQVNGIAWKLILPCFLLAIVITYLKNPFGSPEFLYNIKRLVLTALILVAFPEIAKTIIDITHWIAEEISPGGIQSYWNTLYSKAMTVANISQFKTSLLNIPNLVISVITFLSYLFVLIITYFVIAMRQFIWMVLYIVGPLLIVCNLFSATSNITKGLFKSMFEVASWEIIWVILFKVLATLGLAEMYSRGDILQTIVVNLIIVLSMIGVPFLVKSLVGGGLGSAATGLQAATMGAAFALPARLATWKATSAKGINIAKRTNKGMKNFVSPPQSSTDMYLCNPNSNKSLRARANAFKEGFAEPKKEVKRESKKDSPKTT